MITKTIKLIDTCEKPLFVRNKHTLEVMTVPCGKCQSCLNAKASKQSTRVRNEILKHRYSVMFTLTYDNEHLPKIEAFIRNGLVQFKAIGRVENQFRSLPYNNFDSLQFKINNDVSRLRYNMFDLDLPIIENYDNDFTFGVVCKKDIQDFLKRLRKKITEFIDNEKDRKIRYFIASEYGPTTLRPHYHGVLFFDNEELSSKIADFIVESWGIFRKCKGKNNRGRSTFEPFAHPAYTREAIKMCDPNTSYYVAEYVSSNSLLPKVLRENEFKPFHLSSKNPVIGSFNVSRTEVLEDIHRGNYTRNIAVVRGKEKSVEFVDIPLPEDICSSLFRKCFGFSSLSYASKLDTYTYVANKQREWEKYINKKFKEYKDVNNITDNSFCLKDYLNLNKLDRLRNWCERTDNNKYYALYMDKDATWYASKNASKVCRKYNFFKYHGFGDNFKSYILHFDKYIYLKKMYILHQFYDRFNEIADIVGFETAMLHAYPILSVNEIYLKHRLEYCYASPKLPGLFSEFNFKPYSNVILNDLKSFYNEKDLFNVELFNSKQFNNSKLYNDYVNEQKAHFNDRIKTKKVNNTSLFGVRKIS